MTNNTRAAVRLVIFAVVGGASALGLLNVLGDNAEVQGQAETLVCGKPGCGANKVREERTPFAQSFEFQESRESRRTLKIRCARAYVLLGAYQCENRTPAP